MKRVGAITVGQSPRTDVTADILPILGEDIQLVERGALDGLSPQALRDLEPGEGDYVLVSRLLDGRSVRLAEGKILPRVQLCIDELCASGVEMILMLCTGEFPPSLRSPVPLLYPSRMLTGLVPALTGKSAIGVLVPDSSQLEQNRARWQGIAEAVVLPANPYEGLDPVCRAAQELRELDVDLVVLDCIGYTVEMKRAVQRISGKRVLLPRSALARIVRDIV